MLEENFPMIVVSIPSMEREVDESGKSKKVSRRIFNLFFNFFFPSFSQQFNTFNLFVKIYSLFVVLLHHVYSLLFD